MRASWFGMKWWPKTKPQIRFLSCPVFPVKKASRPSTAPQSSHGKVPKKEAATPGVLPIGLCLQINMAVIHCNSLGPTVET